MCLNSFITGVDKNHEWMLKWWFNNIRKHSDTNITLCDFGMSYEIKEWAKSVADHFIEYPPHPKCAWFYKTRCLLDSPYEKTCWLDSDCEVLTNIDDIFEYAKKDKVGLTKDVPRRGIEWWATGVVVVNGINDTLYEWNKIASKAHLRGDQEAFKALIQENPEFEYYIEEIPNEYQWLRLQLARGVDSKSKRVIHWTGPTGKQHIKKLLKC